MKKTLILFFLFTMLCNGGELIEKKIPLKERVSIRIKDQFGWDKALVEERIKDGTYTETQLKRFTEKVVKEEVEVTLKFFRDKVVKLPVAEINYMKIIKLTPEKMRILVKEIGVLKPEQIHILIPELTVLEIKTLYDLSLFTLNIMKIKDIKIKEQLLTIIETNFLANQLKEKKLIYQESESLKALLRNKIITQYPKKRIRSFTTDFYVADVSSFLNILKVKQEVGKCRKPVILGWDNWNNFDIRDIEKYPIILQEYGLFYEELPDTPVGVMVVLCHETQNEWIKALPFKPDFLAIANVKETANWEKIKRLKFPNYDLVAVIHSGITDKVRLEKNLKEAGWTGYLTY